jgi:hypothetical protein
VARRPAEPAPAKQPIHSAHETNGTVAGILWLTDTRGDIYGVLDAIRSARAEGRVPCVLPARAVLRVPQGAAGGDWGEPGDERGGARRLGGGALRQGRLGQGRRRTHNPSHFITPALPCPLHVHAMRHAPAAARARVPSRVDRRILSTYSTSTLRT